MSFTTNGRHWLAALAIATLGIVLSGDSYAADIDRVEEDWELVVTEPDAQLVSPQATCTMSPVGNLGSDYVVFDVNLRNFPSYEAGGVQLQLAAFDQDLHTGEGHQIVERLDDRGFLEPRKIFGHRLIARWLEG